MTKQEEKEVLKELIHLLSDNNNHLAYLKRTIRSYVKEGFNINTKYLKGNTIAHYIVKYNINGLFLFLKRMGLNLDICNDQYDAPIHLAVRNNRFQLIKELVQAGCDINISCELEQSALHLAVVYANYDIAQLLLDLGIDRSLVDERNSSALDYALDEKDEKMINLLKK